jgi:hypothetical protein
MTPQEIVEELERMERAIDQIAESANTLLWYLKLEAQKELDNGTTES